MTRRTRDILALAGFVAVCLAAGGVGSLLGGPMPDAWYAGLRKPAFTPPGWLFGPVWTVLYVLMGVAAWGVWRQRGHRHVGGALGLFFAQLVLNAAWTGIFFGLHAPFWALVELIVLWVVLLGTTVAFFRVRTWTGVLLLPYLGWVSFAGVLNAAIWQLNRPL